MPILRPSFTQIFASLYTDISTGLGNVPIAQYSILGSFGRALARAVDSCYGYIDNTYLNAVPWSARGVAQESWAALWGITRMDASSAAGTATVTFNAAATIPAGSVWVGANSITYSNTSDIIATGAGTETVDLVTVAKGAATDLPVGSVITLSSLIPNVVPAAIIIQMVGGADAESDTSLFARAQQARSEPPMGGSQGDYIEWALASNGDVTRAWVQTTPAQPGNVVVYIMSDGNSNDGFPIGTDGCDISDTRGTAATGDQAITAAYIYAPYRRPVTAFVTVVSPLAHPINMTITGANPNTVDSQAAVVAALKARFLVIGSPLGMSVYESDMGQAIQSVLTNFNLTIPNSTTSIPLGYLPTVGVVTFS